jgi:dihydroorotate dehydrogenase electron transfer subunit
MPVDVLAEVLDNSRLSDDYNVVALAAPDIARQARPGQFVMIKPGAGLDPLLRRPFSVFEILRTPDGTPSGLTILNKRVGVGTGLLFAARPGDRLACLGPLGTPFEVIDPPARAWLVAGGVGVAPFASLAAALAVRGTDTTLFYGARRAADLHRIEIFEPLGVHTVVATEDGSRGDRGFISVPLARELERLDRRDHVRLYACGPTAMMRAVSALAARHDRRCDVSLEQTMGCGMGGCYSCVVRVRGEDGHGHFVRSCVAGPVFDARAILWDDLGGH